MLTLTNPHAVLAVIACRPAALRAVRLPPRGAGTAWRDVAERAAGCGVGVTTASGPLAGSGGRGRRRPDGVGGRSGRAEADVEEARGVSLDVLLEHGGARRGLWLALDRLQDPRNLGAVFRSAAFFGVAGVLLTRDQSAPMTAVVYDTAAGGVEHVPWAWAANLRRDLGAAREAGLWIVGAAGDGPRDVTSLDRERRWMLVLGNEERGLRRLTREACDEVCRITPRGRLGSLNVSVAAAVMMATLTS